MEALKASVAAAKKQADSEPEPWKKTRGQEVDREEDHRRKTTAKKSTAKKTTARKKAVGR